MKSTQVTHVERYAGKAGTSRSLFRCIGLAITLGVASSAASASIAVGSLAVYSDGSVEKLVERTGESETWEDARYRRITRSRNPVVPDLSRVSLTGEREFALSPFQGDPASVLLVPVGKRVEFSFWRRNRFGDRELRPRHYQCEANGKHTMSFLGTTETVERYTCERFTLHRKLWTKSIKETLTFNYSPRLEMVVDKERVTPKGTSRKTLVSVIAPGEHRYNTLREQLATLKSDARKETK